MSQQANVDNTDDVFKYLMGIMNKLRQKLEARFQLCPEPTLKNLQEYSNSEGNIKGSLYAFSGLEIDWLVHSWLHASEKSNFSTMRLTVWLKSHVRVPHLTFEFGTVPKIFFYIDYIPRTDLLTDLEYLDHYYEQVNQVCLRLQADPRLSPFVSKSVYVRQFQSPISLCYTCSPTQDSLELISTLAHEMLDRWLIWIDEAESVPEEATEALAARDLFVRRTSAERDPGNKLAVQMLGSELTNRLIRALWRGVDEVPTP